MCVNILHMNTQKLSRIKLTSRPDRRSVRRQEVQVHGTARIRGVVYGARLRDVSQGGSALVIPGAPRPVLNERISLTLQQSGAVLRIQAEVKHMEVLSEAVDLGLQFHKVLRNT